VVVPYRPSCNRVVVARGHVCNTTIAVTIVTRIVALLFSTAAQQAGS
jgi:hypothetical protein